MKIHDAAMVAPISEEQRASITIQPSRMSVAEGEQMRQLEQIAAAAERNRRLDTRVKAALRKLAHEVVELSLNLLAYVIDRWLLSPYRNWLSFRNRAERERGLVCLSMTMCYGPS